MNSETAFLTSGQTPGSRDDDPSVLANKRGTSLSELPYPMFEMSTRLFCALRQVVLVFDLWFWWGEAPKRGRLLVYLHSTVGPRINRVSMAEPGVGSGELFGCVPFFRLESASCSPGASPACSRRPTPGSAMLIQL